MVMGRQNAEGRRQRWLTRLLPSALCLLPFVADASQLTVDKRTVSLDDSLTITVTLDDAFSEADVSRLPVQNLSIDGPPSVSSSFEWINGQSSRQKVLRFTAHAFVPGTALVGPLVVNGAGGQIQTLPQVAIEVLPDRLMQLPDPAAILHELLATGRDPIFLVA